MADASGTEPPAPSSGRPIWKRGLLEWIESALPRSLMVSVAVPLRGRDPSNTSVMSAARVAGTARFGFPAGGTSSSFSPPSVTMKVLSRPWLSVISRSRPFITLRSTDVRSPPTRTARTCSTVPEGWTSWTSTGAPSPPPPRTPPSPQAASIAAAASAAVRPRGRRRITLPPPPPADRSGTTAGMCAGCRSNCFR
jgi:hypothetical protein